MIGALGGEGIRSGLPSLAQLSSINSVIEGKGRMIPGLSVSLRCSNAAATASVAMTGSCPGAGAPAGHGPGGDVVGGVTFTFT